MADDRLQTYWDAPAPVVLPASRKQTWFLFIGSLIFVVGGIFAIHHGLQTKAFDIEVGTAFFALGVLIGAYVLIVPKSWSLILDDNGLTLKRLWRSVTCKWGDIESSFIVNMPAAVQVMDTIEMVRDPSPQIPYSTRSLNMICFNVKKSSPFFRAINQALTGYTSGFGNIYNLSTGDLVKLLNHWREKSLKLGA